MVRNALQQSLAWIRKDLLQLAESVGDATTAALGALVDHDRAAAERILTSDSEINALRASVERACLVTIATQQPAGRDARLLAGTLEVATELERMGDYAKHIARASLELGPLSVPEPIPRLVANVTQLLKRAMEAYLARDGAAATQLAQRGKIDGLCQQTREELMDRLSNDPVENRRVVGLLGVVHDLERFAQRITNICERTVLVSTGELVEFDSQE